MAKERKHRNIKIERLKQQIRSLKNQIELDINKNKSAVTFIKAMFNNLSSEKKKDEVAQEIVLALMMSNVDNKELHEGKRKEFAEHLVSEMKNKALELKDQKNHFHFPSLVLCVALSLF